MREKFVIKLFYTIRVALIVFLLVGIINMYFFSLSTVRQSSMESTLFNNNLILINKFVDTRELDYGDIVIFVENKNINGGLANRFKLLISDIISNFKTNDENFRLVKRIIAKEGDEVNISDGYVYVNGIQIKEDYINQMTAKGDLEYPIIVSKGKYFVLGDNREVSRDSRVFGAIDSVNIEGKVGFRILPFSNFGKVN